MGNIITSANSFNVDDNGNIIHPKDTTFMGVSTFDGTGTFNKNVNFKDTVEFDKSLTANKSSTFLDNVYIGSEEIPKILYINGTPIDTGVFGGNFSSVINATKGLSASTGTFSGELSGTIARFSDRVYANAGITATDGTYSDKLTVNGDLEGKKGIFSDKLTANGGLESSSGNFTSDLTTNGKLTANSATINNVLSTGKLTTDILEAKSATFTDLTGNVTGKLKGDVTGNVTGNVEGNLTGELKSPETKYIKLFGGDISSTGNIAASNLTGNLTGNLNSEITTYKTLSGIDINSTGNINANIVTVEKLQGNVAASSGTFSELLEANNGFKSKNSVEIIHDQENPKIWNGTEQINSGGLIINGENKWTIGEVATSNGTRLCFSKGDIPFACIDPITSNLTLANDENWLGPPRPRNR